MATSDAHRPLCTIELIAEGRATRCPASECAFWDGECLIARIESDLDRRPEVAEVLLEIRRELGRARRAVGATSP
jgi:hypothetical protein